MTPDTTSLLATSLTTVMVTVVTMVMVVVGSAQLSQWRQSVRLVGFGRKRRGVVIRFTDGPQRGQLERE